jgi:hypothetical protein
MLQATSATPSKYLITSQWSIADIVYLSLLALVAFSHCCLAVCFCFFWPRQ